MIDQIIKYRVVLYRLALIFVFFNLTNSQEYFARYEELKIAVYLGIQILGLVLLFREIILDIRNPDGWIKSAWNYGKNLNIPKSAKIATMIVLTGNIVHIAIGQMNYPFSDVGMFRYPTDFREMPAKVNIAKYYYWSDGEAQILDIRQQHIMLMRNYFNWRHNNEFTFALAYHNKGQRANFEYLRRIMQSQGVDSLWVGIQTVNYETGEVTFDHDPVNAISANRQIRYFYGPLYVPEYQLEMKGDYDE